MLSQLPWLLLLLAAVPLQRIVVVIRKKVWESSMYKGGNQWIKPSARYLNDNWGAILLVEILSFLVGVVILISFVFGADKLLEGFIFGMALVLFLAFQFPRLLKPAVYIALLSCDKEGYYIDIGELEKPTNEIELTAGENHFFMIHIVNLGINAYENCGVWASFEKPLKPIVGPELLEEYKRLHLDFTKRPQYQRQNNALWYMPTGKFGFGPANVLLLRAFVQTPEEVRKYHLDIEVSSSTRWASKVKRFYLNIKPHSETTAGTTKETNT